jgi:hypothetical protein
MQLLRNSSERFHGFFEILYFLTILSLIIPLNNGGGMQTSQKTYMSTNISTYLNSPQHPNYMLLRSFGCRGTAEFDKVLRKSQQSFKWKL